MTSNPAIGNATTAPAFARVLMGGTPTARGPGPHTNP